MRRPSRGDRLLDQLFPAPRSMTSRPGDPAAAGPILTSYDDGLPDQAYRLDLGPDGVRIVAGAEAGVRHARVTLRQLIRLCRQAGTDLPSVLIEDEPAFAVRAVMLDVSRDRVPHVETLIALAHMMADWKLNQLQLYLEHTFAYAGHEEVWRDASPYTRPDIDRLERVCRELGIELLLQQNCLGHAERWLRHPAYAHLAALPGGYRDEAGNAEPAATLDPASEEAFALVTDWVQQLVDAQPFAQRLHVGLDEPLDLNPALWRAIFAEDPAAGSFEVSLGADEQAAYISWMRRLRELPQLKHREMVMWADVASANEAVMQAVPDRVTLVEWGYEAGHPFEQRTRRLAEQGIPFWVCAGTSTWTTLAGRPANARANIAAAARAGSRHGAGGLVISDWGDDGHTQQFSWSLPVFALAAGYAWHPAAGDEVDWPWLINRHVFGDRAGLVGSTMLGVAGLYASLSVQVPESSALAACLGPVRVLERLAAGGLSLAEMTRTEADLGEFLETLDGVDLGGSDATIVLAELGFTIRLLRYGARRMRDYLSGDRDPDGLLTAEHGLLLAEYERLWHLRCRPGGLSHSRSVLAGASPVIAAEPGIECVDEKRGA